MRRKLAAGNWKMNGTGPSLAELEALKAAHPNPTVDILLCPPATLVSRAAATLSASDITVGGQDCHANAKGAHTGDISAQMLKDAGATAVIVGHSERRQDHGETNASVRDKANAAQSAGLVAVICLGETLAEREAGDTLNVVSTQLAGSLPDKMKGDALVVAYEPVWAIGTGLVPSLEQIAEVHDALRADLVTRAGATEGAAIRLLYGGSVKAGNAAEIFGVPNVDGALVGGASLTAADFSPIVTALEASPA